MYRKYYGVIQTRAYSLVLLSYVRANERDRKNIINNNWHISIASCPEMDSVVSFLIRSNIDSSLTIANLIFRFFCSRGDIRRADVYFERMKAMGHQPCTTALVAFGELLVYLQDKKRSYNFYFYLSEKKLIPTSGIVGLMIYRTIEIGDVNYTVDTVAYILRNFDQCRVEWYTAVAEMCFQRYAYVISLPIQPIHSNVEQ